MFLCSCSGSVFCVALDPLGKMAASGGEDDRGYVWRTDNQDILFQCAGEGEPAAKAMQNMLHPV